MYGSVRLADQFRRILQVWEGKSLCKAFIQIVQEHARFRQLNGVRLILALPQADQAHGRPQLPGQCAHFPPKLQRLLEACQRLIPCSQAIPLQQQLALQAVELGLEALPGGDLQARAEVQSPPTQQPAGCTGF